MDAVSFIATVVLVTASGALAPGPLFFVTVSHGAKSGAKSGLIFSVAHTMVEFALVILLASGLLAVANEPAVKIIVGVAGGVALISFGLMQIRESLWPKPDGAKHREPTTRNLLLIGLAFTGLNPFFIVWWLTVGAQLILLAIEFASFYGILFMYACHVWIDYVWLVSVAHFAKIGMNVAGLKWYRAVMTIFGAALAYFGITFLFSSFGLS